MVHEHTTRCRSIATVQWTNKTKCTQTLMNANSTSQQPQHHARWKVIFQYYQLKTIFMEITWEYKKKSFRIPFFPFSQHKSKQFSLNLVHYIYRPRLHASNFRAKKKNFSSLLFLKTCSELKTHNKVVQRPGPRHLQHKVAHARLCRKFS